MRNIASDLKNIVGNNIKINYDITNYLTFRVKTFAKFFVEIYNKDTLIKLLKFCDQKKIRYFVIGGGSNCIFRNKYVKHLVVHLNNGYSKFYIKNGEFYLYSFAGNKVGNLIKKCKEKGFSCLEWAVGIPATVGGAVFMNMGAFSYSMQDIVYSVTYYKGGKIFTIIVSEKDFEYRNSLFKKEKCVILNVVLKIKKCERCTLQSKILDFLKQKASLQPLNMPSCGSVFKNGKEFKVAYLIEQLNLKGYSFGGASISSKHSNFIVNDKDATSGDVVALINIIKQKIYSVFKLRIYEEIIITDF